MNLEQPVAQLSASEKRALLAKLLRERANRPERYPLSFAQQRLWFLSQLDPESPAYNVHRGLSVRGRVRWSAFYATLQEVVRRHKSLRTTFEELDHEAVQVVSPAGAAHASLTDLQALPADVQRGEVERLALEVRQLPFNLQRGPLARVHLLRLSALDSVLLIALHHIISDGWSLAIFIRELASIYVAFAAGQPSPLPEPSYQYVDFAVQQRQELQGEILEGQLRHWRDRLQRSPVLELPTDRPRPAVRKARGGAANIPCRGGSLTA